MAAVEFDKMQGSGNDFILIDNRAGVVPEADKTDFVRRVCPRRTAVGADGVIFLEEDPELDFRWHFFNADGSEAEMCGNGARCMAVFAHRVGAAGDAMTFRTVAGPIRANLVPGGARVQLTDAAPLREIKELSLESGAVDLHFIDTGVPHAVMVVDDIEAVDVVALGRAIRRHTAFAPAGTNANFIARDGGGIAIRTYERGVEDETLACGTGSVAAAIVAGHLWGLLCPVSIRTRSGIVLEVEYRATDEGITDVFLTGPVETVYHGRLA